MKYMQQGIYVYVIHLMMSSGFDGQSQRQITGKFWMAENRTKTQSQSGPISVILGNFADYILCDYGIYWKRRAMD